MPAITRTEVVTLEGVPLFEGLDYAALVDLYNCAKTQHFAAGQVLFRQEDEAKVLYLVQSGRIRVSETTHDGEEVLLRFIEPRQMLGAMTALEKVTYPVTAEAVNDSQVLTWSHNDIDGAMDRHPRLMRNTMRLMVSRIRELQQRCVELATEHVEQRVARAVLRLADQVGKQTPQGVALDMRLSRQDLAALTGTTLYTVSRILNRWSHKGILVLGRQSVVLARPDDLAIIADNLAPESL